MMTKASELFVGQIMRLPNAEWGDVIRVIRGPMGFLPAGRVEVRAIYDSPEDRKREIVYMGTYDLNDEVEVDRVANTVTLRV